MAIGSWKNTQEFPAQVISAQIPEMIPKIYEIRDIVGLRIVAWNNKNRKDPVKQCQNEIKNRSVKEVMKDSSAHGKDAVSASSPETIPAMSMDLDEFCSTVMEKVRDLHVG